MQIKYNNLSIYYDAKVLIKQIFVLNRVNQVVFKGHATR